MSKIIQTIFILIAITSVLIGYAFFLELENYKTLFEETKRVQEENKENIRKLQNENKKLLEENTKINLSIEMLDKKKANQKIMPDISSAEKIKEFQLKHGLTQTGKIGPKTQDAINQYR